MLDKSQRSD